MKKILSATLILLSLALVSYDSMLDKEVLLTGVVIKPGLDGKLEFSISHQNFNIKSINLTGRILIFSKNIILPVTDIKKDTLNQISVSESVDKIVRINVDPHFSHHGGFVYIDLTTADQKNHHYTLLILKENKKFRIYRKNNDTYKPVSFVTIELDSNKQIKNHFLR